MSESDDCIIKIIPTSIFNTSNPIVLGGEIVKGNANIGMHLSIPSKNDIHIGHIESIEINTMTKESANVGDFIVIKIVSGEEIVYGYDFDFKDLIVGKNILI